MAKEKIPPKDTSGEVPAWFMTYSDVITLLMTFFILLLTFASHEPERFERMKITVFGAGASDGIAGDKTDSLDRESVTFRYRPEKSRLTRHGSETPPEESDLTTSGPSKGMLELEEPSELADFQRLRFSTSRNSLFTKSGQLTGLGKERIAMISKQLSRRDMRLAISVPGVTDIGPAVQLAHDMTYTFGIPLGRVAVGMSQEHERAGARSNMIHFTLIRKVRKTLP